MLSGGLPFLGELPGELGVGLTDFDAAMGLLAATWEWPTLAPVELCSGLCSASVCCSAEPPVSALSGSGDAFREEREGVAGSSTAAGSVLLAEASRLLVLPPVKPAARENFDGARLGRLLQVKLAASVALLDAPGTL